jgi:predicted permease
MSVAELGRRVRYLLFRDRYAAVLEEEIRTHIDHRAAALRATGLSPAEARYEARRRFGNPVTIEERSRDMWGLTLLEHAAADFRFAIRRLRTRPGFSIATILVAALGIGATTAVFSAIDAAMLRPLPFMRPSELYSIHAEVPFDPGRELPPQRHRADINDVATMTDVFSSIGVYAAGALNLTDPDNPARLNVGVVSRDFFATLGAPVALGRNFDESETRPRGPNVVILSDAFWRSRFGRRAVLGQTISLSGQPYAIVGVMSPGFDFPNRSDAWIPLTVPTTFDSFAAFRGFLPTKVIARVQPGITREIASSRLIAKWVQLAGPSTNDPSAYIDKEIAELRAKGAATPLQEELVGDGRTALAILMGATLLLLLIACANVANLLLSDAASRRREVALREVLGATRGRITRQLLAESVLLALAGALLGIALAPTVLGLLRTMMPANLAGVAPAELDLRVLAFATLLALASGIVFGSWPALTATRGNAAETIKSGGGLGATASGLGRARRFIITTEIALTVMLLVGAGLMLRSFEKVVSQDLGLRADHVATLELSVEGRGRAAIMTKLHGIVDRLESDPAIEAAAVVNDLPFRIGSGMSVGVTVDGAPPTDPNDTRMSRYLMASGNYFKTLGIPLLRGRTFTTADDSLAPPVAVINMAMAKAFWPDRDPIGQKFTTAARAPVTVIGIVGDIRERSLERDVVPQMYFSIDDMSPSNAALLARSALPREEFLSRVRAAVRAVDPAQAVYNVRMMDDVISTSMAKRRTNTVLIALFGGLALLLSSFGIYAVVSHGVTRRAREFGIRAALGATSGDIVALIGRELAMITGIGLAIGLAGAWALSRVIAALLYGVEPHDLATFLIVPAALAIPALIAGWPPARRAMGISPMEVMRAE